MKVDGILKIKIGRLLFEFMKEWGIGATDDRSKIAAHLRDKVIGVIERHERRKP